MKGGYCSFVSRKLGPCWTPDRAETQQRRGFEQGPMDFAAWTLFPPSSTRALIGRSALPSLPALCACTG